MGEFKFKKEMWISFFILSVFYLIILIWKYFNPFDFPGLEKRVMYVLMPLTIICVLMGLDGIWIRELFEKIRIMAVKGSIKITNVSNKIKKQTHNKTNLRNNIKKSFWLSREKTLKLFLIFTTFFLKIIKGILNLMFSIIKRCFLVHDFDKKARLILSFGLFISCLALFMVKGPKIVIILAFVFSCFECYLALTNMKSRRVE